MDKNAAAQALRRMAVQYQAMVEAADLFEKIGPIEQAEAEARARVDAVLREEVKAHAAVAAREQEMRAAVAKQEALRANANREAEVVKNAAAAEAKKIVEAAYEQATRLTEKVKTELAQREQDSAQRIAAAEKRIALLGADEKGAAQRATAALDAAAAAQAKLDAIRKQIAKFAAE